MTDPEVPAGAGGGPRWVQEGTRSAAVPSVVNANAPTRLGVESERPVDLFGARYSRNGITPVPFAIVAFALMGAAWWALDWAKLVPGAPDPVEHSEWWVTITSVLVPGEGHGLGAYSVFRMWVALGILIIAAIAIAVWIGRIGGNIRSGHQPFGALLPLIAFPAWWLVPVTVGIASDASRSRADSLLRWLIGFAILVAQFLLARWPTLNRIWRAGRLPYDVASIVLWLPMLVPWAMIYLSNAWTFFAMGDNGEPSDSSWQPTDGMLDWARWMTRVTGVAILILLVVVTVAQHVGLTKDRAEDDAARLV